MTINPGDSSAIPASTDPRLRRMHCHADESMGPHAQTSQRQSNESVSSAGAEEAFADVDVDNMRAARRTPRTGNRQIRAI